MISTSQAPILMTIAPENWEVISNALRLELQEYGELLNLLTKQQNDIINRNAGGIFELNDSINKQIRISQEFRTKRERIVASFAEGFGMPRDASLKSMLRYFPEKAHFLLKALIDEIYATTEKTHHRARQNQMLIKRATEKQILEMLKTKNHI